MLDYMLYTRALENVILWGLLALPLAELAVLCLLTLNNLPPQRRRGLSALCLASALLVGTLLGGLWALGPSEQVVTYGGWRVILGNWGWGSGYQLYEYHGPLVRGAGPFLVDWDESLLGV